MLGDSTSLKNAIILCRRTSLRASSETSKLATDARGIGYEFPDKEQINTVLFSLLGSSIFSILSRQFKVHLFCHYCVQPGVRSHYRLLSPFVFPNEHQ